MISLLREVAPPRIVRIWSVALTCFPNLNFFMRNEAIRHWTKRKGATAMPIKKQRKMTVFRQKAETGFKRVSRSSDNWLPHRQDLERTWQERESPFLRPIHPGLENDGSSSVDCLGEHFEKIAIDTDATTAPDSLAFEKPTSSLHQNQDMRYSGVYLLLSCLEKSAVLKAEISNCSNN